MPQQKPHVLLLINDEHRPDILPIEGDQQVRTPTLDRFINEGVYFRNAYTPSPICVPARINYRETPINWIDNIPLNSCPDTHPTADKEILTYSPP